MRRAKAAELAGETTILANIIVDNEVVAQAEVEIADLLSPTANIDVSSTEAAMERWQSIYDATSNGEELPAIDVTPGTRGTPIGGVGFE